MAIAKLVLRKIKRLLDKILGTKTDEFYWRFRHLLNKRWSENYILQDSINNLHRKFLIDKISTLAPLKNILEIGCASGPNLYLLSKRFPNSKIYGTDISSKAIATGKKWFENKNIKNIFLFTAKAENLKNFPDKSIDVVFTDATLICIGPDKIGKVIKEMLRVVKKAIILIEWHSDLPKSFYNDHWVHNYKLLFNKFISEDNIKFTKIDPGLWGGDWGKLGYIIEVIL